MTRVWCWDHIWCWPGGHIGVFCRYKHLTKYKYLPELEGVDLSRQWSQEEWKAFRDGSRLE